MRFAQVPELAIRDAELTPSEFKALVALYCFVDKRSGMAWPSREVLADLLGFKNPSEVSKVTARLERKGWLKKNKKTAYIGTRRYQISVPSRLRGVAGNGVGGQTAHPEGGQTAHPEGGQTAHPEGGQTAHPEGGQTAHPEGGQTAHPEGGQTAHPEGGQTAHPEGGQTAHLLRTYQEHTNEHTNSFVRDFPDGEKKLPESSMQQNQSTVSQNLDSEKIIPPPEKKPNVENPRYRAAAEAMWKKIQPITKQARPPNFDHWARDVRLLVERDGRTLEDVWRVFEFANRDDFWKSNILSPAKLRKQFPALYARMGTGAVSGQAGRVSMRDRSLEDDLTDRSWAAGFEVRDALVLGDA